MADRVTFTNDSATRIAKVVRIVEAGNRNTAARVLSPRGLGSGGGGGVRLATFTGAWALDQVKTVTFKNQTSTPNTASVLNTWLSLNPTGTAEILIARGGRPSGWFLVNAKMSNQPNYNANAGTQAFTIATGNMEWADVQACPSEDASPRSLSFFYG